MLGWQGQLESSPQPSLSPALREQLDGRRAEAEALKDRLTPADDAGVRLAVVLHRGQFGRHPKRYRHMFRGLAMASFAQFTGEQPSIQDALCIALEELERRQVTDCPTTMFYGRSLTREFTLREYWTRDAQISAQLNPPTGKPAAPLACPTAPQDLDWKLAAAGEQQAQIDACGRALGKIFDAAASERMQAVEAMNVHVAESEVPRFVELVSHQSQLHANVVHVERDELVGADLTAITFSWEIGFANVDTLRKRDGCQQPLNSVANSSKDNPWEPCLPVYREFMANEDTQIRAAHRLAFKFSYGHLSELQVDLDDYLQAEGSAGGDTGGSPLAPLDPLLDPLLGGDGGGGGGGGGSAGLAFGEGPEVDLPATNVLSFTAAYGRQLQAPTPGDPLQRASRLDIAADYEHFGSAVGRRDRWSLTATLSYQIAGLSFPFQLGYRSNSGFDDAPLEDELRALAGVAMDLGSPPSLGLGK